MKHVRNIHLGAVVAAFCAAALVTPASAIAEQGTAHLHGRIVAVSGGTLSLRLRTGRIEKVDIAEALAAHHTGALAVGEAVIVYGERDASGTFHVVSVGHVGPNPKDWTPDD